MKTYDNEQQAAIEAAGGYYLVLAPPGCGKTDILTERIVHARQHGVGFDEMLCLTFTNRASRGMRERIRQRVGEEARQIFVGNVHRFCSNFLFANAIVPEDTCIIDEDEVADILASLYTPMFSTHSPAMTKTTVNTVDQVEAYIAQRLLGQPSTALFMPEELERYYQEARSADFDPERVGPLSVTLRLALQYRRYKQARKMISFTDILIRAYDVLRTDKNRTYKRYRWIQVDEVQDLNALQTAIVDELLDKSQTFTAMYLGDEQQAIFSFLGAKLGQLQLLKQRCEGHIMTLGTNYRSPKYLLDIFNTYAEAELGMDASLLPQATSDAPHDKFDLILTGNASVEDEEERLTKMIKYYLGFDHERVAILVPTNKAADRVSEKLFDNGIAHFKISGTDLFKSKSYKTLSSLFGVVANDFNSLAWARLLYGIGAVDTSNKSRELVAILKSLMMTPSDLLTEKSYLARFNEEYERGEFVFFDTETTGLNVLADDIVQIAAFKVRQGKRVEGSDFVVFMHTDKEIPAKLGDLDNPLVKAYASNPHLTREEGLRRFIDYIGHLPLLGHNVDYDYQILQKNVERTLHLEVAYDVYDSLRLIKYVEPGLRKYKLAYLLERLQLEGNNSHLADEDIAATKSLVDYCFQKSQGIAARQQAFAARPKVKLVVERMASLRPVFAKLRAHLYQPVSDNGHSIADELKSVYDDLHAMQLVDDLGEKFNVFLKFVATEWTDDETEQTLHAQICRHINDMTASVNEGDLVNSAGLISDRIFVMTIHKAKGLEFENIVVLEANDGTYPFYKTNQVLAAPERHEPYEVAQAEMERKEDARKFYVALSRAKKRICVSYTYRNSYGYATRPTPFINSIKKFFTTG